MMITLFTDLDHTLIFSHRAKPNTKCVTVEELNGQAQSFITEYTWNSLFHIVKSGAVRIVPVTTRTREQYARLHILTECLEIQEALVCNGAVLLKGDQLDEQWLTDSYQLAEKELDDIHKAYQLLKEFCPEEKTHYPYGVMAYGTPSNLQQCETVLREHIDLTKCCIGHDRRKLYCIPKSLHKGEGIKRFRKRHKIDESISVGDSEFDIPMFSQTEMAVFPTGLDYEGHGQELYRIENNIMLSDATCDILKILTDNANDRKVGRL